MTSEVMDVPTRTLAGQSVTARDAMLQSTEATPYIALPARAWKKGNNIASGISEANGRYRHRVSLFPIVWLCVGSNRPQWIARRSRHCSDGSRTSRSVRARIHPHS